MKKYLIFIILILSNLSIHAETIRLSCSPPLSDSKLILKAINYDLYDKIEFSGNQALNSNIPSYEKELGNRQELIGALKRVEALFKSDLEKLSDSELILKAIDSGYYTRIVFVGSQALNPDVPSYEKELGNRQELINLLDIYKNSELKKMCDYNNCPEYLTLFPIQKLSSNTSGLEVEADESEILDGNYLLSGNVEVTSEKLFLSGDNMEVSTSDDTILAKGNVKFQDSLYLISGESLSAEKKNNNITAIATNANYQDYSVGYGANGYTEFIEKTPTYVLLNNSTYSLCPINKSDWLIEASQIKLDTDKNRGVANNALLKFYGVPILYTPKYSWVLSGRGSGFLSPDYSSYRESGKQNSETRLRLPYYFNLAPDRDLLTALTFMSSRGIVYEGKYRQLLNSTSDFEIEAKYLPEDKITNLKRWLIDFSEELDLSNKVNLSSRFYRVSDPKYFEEIDKANNDVKKLTSFLKYSYKDTENNLSLSVLTENEQIVNKGTPAYNRDLEGSFSKIFNANSKMPFQVDLLSTQFSHDDSTKNSGTRTHGDFRISRELNIEYPIVTPHASTSITNYSLKNSPNINRVIFGTGFNIDFTTSNKTNLFGFNVNHKLSPLISYNYRAKKVQGNIPLFDSTDKYDDIISFADLTSGERYTGLDRITNANDINLSLVSSYRKVDALEDDKDLLSMKIAQTYFTDDEVVSDSLNTNYETRKSYSDIVASIDIALNKFSLSSALQYNPKKSEIAKKENTITYNPASKKFISLKFIDDGAEETEKFYGAYPITGSVHVFGGLDRTTSSGKTNSQTTGIAYESCCWAFRLAHFKDDNSSGGYNYTTGMELIFSGLGSSDTNLQNKIENKIPGYLTNLR
ncbi:LPS assembly protein LptD [Candidatus Thioglobus sp.]|nr:LPS assembly protein LptD [Candidatus Thioglobus sp.]